MNPQLRLFLVAMMLMGAAAGMFETTFNNFLSDTFDISADARGRLEFPRELPGFLTALFAGMLFFLPETVLGAVAAFSIGIGMLGLAYFGDASWGAMMTFLVLWSCGVHLMMPVGSSVSMHLADSRCRGRRLGQIRAVAVASSILGCSVVWLSMKRLQVDYRFIFALGGIAAIAGALFMLRMRLPGAHLRRPRFVWRRRYWLYYALAALFGARKQIFITFGPWVLIRVFDQQAHIIAQLWIVSAVLGIVFQPALGRAIDRFGERRVLMWDSVCVFLVCTGYGCSHFLESRQAALWLLYVCYVADHLLFGVNMARDTYISKTVVHPADVAPSLSMAITINHAVSMSVPALGGYLWIHYGHPTVFMGAAGIAVVMFVFSSLVRVRQDG